MKERHELSLQFRGQVDEQITTDEDIQFGKRGVHNQVLGGESHHLPNLLTDPVVVSFLDKITLQELGRDIGTDIGGINPLARLVDRIPIKVGGKDLYFE